MDKRGTRALTLAINAKICPKSKRSQVTIFIIIAIVIIVGISAFFIMNKLNVKIFTSETDEIYLFVENCVKETGINVVYDVGKTGGYFFVPNFSVSGIPYYYSEGESYMPSKTEIGNEISYFITKELPFCIKNFTDFPDFIIEQREIETKTQIKDEEVILNVGYPISVTKEDSTTIFKEFRNIKIPIRLGIIYDAIEEVIQEQLTHESICLSCISDISIKNDLYFDMINYDEETVIFSVRDENSKLNEEAFEFVFANKYKIE